MGVLEYKEYIIGYKNDLIKYLEEEIKRIREDKTIDNEWVVVYIKDSLDAIEELKKRNSMDLLAISDCAMGGLQIRQVEIDILDF